MKRSCSTIVRCWGTRPNLHVSGYLWVTAMFGVLAFLEANRIGIFLVPPFGATLTILMLLPDAAVAQPYALIAGSVGGAAVGTGVSFFGRGVALSVLAMIVAFLVFSPCTPIILRESRWHRFRCCCIPAIGSPLWLCFLLPSWP